MIFRLQFHTGAVQGYNLMFEKEDMEAANKGREQVLTRRQFPATPLHHAAFHGSVWT